MLQPTQSAPLAQKVAEVHVQTLPVTEVWVGATTVKHNLRYTLLNDLKVLGPSVETGRVGRGERREIEREREKK